MEYVVVVVECAVVAAGGAEAAGVVDFVANVGAAESVVVVVDAGDAVVGEHVAAEHVAGTVFVFAASAIVTGVDIVVKDVKSLQKG